MKKAIFIALCFWISLSVSLAQKLEITGESPNYYLKVDEVLSDGVRITQTLSNQLTHFNPGDKVLLIQHTGVVIDSLSPTFKTTEARSKKSVQNTGNFEILQVDEVEMGSDTTIYFTDNLANSYDNYEKIQLVKLIEGETVSVSGQLYSKPWDGNVGGIIGIIGTDTVKLKNGSIIDVSNKGFRGASPPVEIYTSGCRYGLSDLIKDTLYFRKTQLGRSGNKGEGIITTRWPYTKGTGFNINGGGAGNGRFSGGGGGSNYRLGGDGGKQSASCTGSFSANGGWGGFACKELYDNPLIPRIVMGGGGGTGTLMNGSTPSRGGNGGGIIIIITDILQSESGTASIRSNGENATPSSTAGSGAGGGAGGTIIIDATEIIGPLFNIRIRGGNGSSTTTAAPNCNGGGGSGSGGVFWHAGPSFPLVTIDSLNGSPGTTAGGITYADQIGRSGLLGTKLKHVILPLSGFLFNSIKGKDTICAGQVPDLFTGSQPKGGNGSYTFIWQQSDDEQAWSSATGNGTLRTFQPGALNHTVYYRRIVSSSSAVNGEIIRDTSRSVQVFVYPAIENNAVLGNDTLCYNKDAKPLAQMPGLSGGNGTYSYVWQTSPDNNQWTQAGTGSVYDPPALTSSSLFRRIVKSTKYCSDTSNTITIRVIPSIANNVFIHADTAICENMSPGRLNISLPTGGENVFTYQWLRKSGGTWTTIPQTRDSVRYTSGNLSGTTEFRRIVYSGNDDACIDTSNSKLIEVKPSVKNNLISGASVSYACYQSALSIYAVQPTDGFGTYQYVWQKSPDQITWGNTGVNRDLVTENLTQKTYFRRIVYSGPERQCSSTSAVKEIRINALPTGNVINLKDTICAGSELYVKFNAFGNGPFSVSISDNTQELSKSNIAGPLDSISFMPVSNKTYKIISLQDDSGCYANPSLFVPLNVGMVYDIPSANAGTDSSICSNTFTLGAVKSNPAYVGLWSGQDALFEAPTSPNSTVSVGLFGKHEFKWTERNWNCKDEDLVEITFDEQPAIPEAGHNQELDFIYQAQLQATPASVGSGRWTVISGSGTFEDDSSPETLVKEVAPHTWLKWTVTNGTCPSADDSLYIIVKPLHIAKGFTPDGDPNNEFFAISHINAEHIELKVFNSAGVLVFESSDYHEGTYWDGKNKNGTDLPEGTYYYVARIKVVGRAEYLEIKSFVEILRK